MKTDANTVRKVKLYRTVPDRILLACVWLLMLLIMLVILVPILFILASSFSSPEAVSAGKVLLWPVDFSLAGYEVIFQSPNILKGFLNSIAYTFAATVIGVGLTLLAGYPLSRKDLKIRGPVMFLFTVTMFFNGGMIPTYLVVSRLHLIDSFWAMVLPTAMGVWNVILIKTYIQSSIPLEIYESASIDGCSDWKYFLNMVIPLSKPIIAVMVLLYAVGKWNDFMSGLLYINTTSKYPLQLILRNILVMNDSTGMAMNLTEQMSRQAMKNLMQYSLIIVSSVPVMILYPFIQKYFVKGIMMGSIKG
ncbi:MAG TPA: carbohydrate ABC transporter permease [Candidatus Eisenbergiella merdavium]|uniref:Carbohydrate ABC transporter permease n=1 Tax=Candidatus Eisenbergiella merdavium TaxID=2838551 RepID=A0A9D2NKK9_9FIRM|nr:carbohydrate ABC transporter permease [Candidatus Eisenbergiella merdavium]